MNTYKQVTNFLMSFMGTEYATNLGDHIGIMDYDAYSAIEDIAQNVFGGKVLGYGTSPEFSEVEALFYVYDCDDCHEYVDVAMKYFALTDMFVIRDSDNQRIYAWKIKK